VKLVNETQQEVFYTISTINRADCGTIEVDGVADWPAYDSQVDVTVAFSPAGNGGAFQITVDDTHTGEQVEMAVVAEV
jgi:hypothetical protein